MALELLKIVPPEIIMSILSKLPVGTIAICKCVCKAWLHLVETREFVKSHLSTSVPGLVITYEANIGTRLFKFFEVEDGRVVECHDLHYNLVTKIRLPFSYGWTRGSIDGLFWLFSQKTDVIYICNPITRDYINIHTPSNNTFQLVTCGFGSCKMTGQYKVVWMLLHKIFDKEKLYHPVMSIAECRVYTLGAGSRWRRLPPCALLHCVPLKHDYSGAFANGNLHWLGCDLKISCFDLETERFSTFSAPPFREATHVILSALGGSLCLCEATCEDQTIWLMEEYGIAESWTKKLVIKKQVSEDCYAYILHPIKVFKDGDILMAINGSSLFWYSTKTRTIRRVDDKLKENCGGGNAICHTPSFRSLKSFEMENVSSF